MVIAISFKSNIFNSISRIISIIKEKFFSLSYWSIREYSNFMISIDSDDFGLTIGIQRMICKADFVSFSSRIDTVIRVQIEKKTTFMFVINFSTPFCLTVGYQFATVFRYELIFTNILLKKRIYFILMDTLILYFTLRYIPHPATSDGASKRCLCSPL